MKKITVVTVCYNCEELIERTIKSVLSQTIFNDIQYIIIDGASTDNTLSIINKYKHEIDIVISEKDSGIYNAMNKGIDHSESEWIIFMNAGDEFFSNNALESVFKRDESFEEASIIGCETFFKTPRGNFIEKIKSVEERWICIPACHQSMLIRTSIHKQYKFDESWKICSDHFNFNKIINEGYKFLGVKTVLSVFSFDGVSAKNRIALYQEKKKIAILLNSPFIEKVKLTLIIFRLKLVRWIKSKFKTNPMGSF